MHLRPCPLVIQSATVKYRFDKNRAVLLSYFHYYGSHTQSEKGAVVRPCRLMISHALMQQALHEPEREY